MPSFDLYPNPLGFPLAGSDMPASPASTSEPKRRRRKDDASERDPDSAKIKSTHKSSSTRNLHRKRSTSRERDRDRDRDSPRSSILGERSSRKKVEMVVPEMERRPESSSEVKPRMSYPTFSKAHSREAVGSMEDVRNTKPLTPAATDMSSPEKSRRRASTPVKAVPPTNPPPSPPLTADNPDIRRSGSGSSIRDAAREAMSDRSSRRSTEGTPRGSAAKGEKSGASLRREAQTQQPQFQHSEISSMPGAFPEDIERRTTPSSGYRRTVSTATASQSELTQNTQDSRDTRDSESTVDSGATTVPPERKIHTRGQARVVDDSSPSFTDSAPRTPVYEAAPTKGMGRKTPAIIDVGAANLATPQSFGMTPLTAVPPPPPPPPPMNTNKEPPRVDYLLKNGGLPTMVPRRLVQTGPAQQYSTYQSPAILQQAPLEEYSKIFSSIHKRLDDYLQVLRTSGSLAVATGYKSVARRLLDKLSQVFARDISGVRCNCVVCGTVPKAVGPLSDEEDSGISWGEILEIVSGRQQLPPWPPFAIAPASDEGGLGISGVTAAPMQKLDIDVPEEYKDHYIRQNQKTKRAVQSWLAQQPSEFPLSPPEEADEDTLMFAMMTKLPAQERNLFIALMHGQASVSMSRAPTPAERPKDGSNTVVQRAGKAIKRLYRLEKAPRDCESAVYLLTNPHLHGMLATLAEVNEGEWDILVSGRFDGFLWSGAEAPFPPSASQYASPVASRAPSRGANGTPFSRNMTPFSGVSAGGQQSRGPTPFRNVASPFSADGTPQQTPAVLFPSRGPTPGMGGVTPPAPVQMDEDTEIAVLAEVERNLFNDMERFEDAFEILHSRAELVRGMLRERSAGLSLQSQLRRGSSASDAGLVRLDTPASGITDFEEGDEDDDGLGDTASLAPDDSASQISVNRRHRRRVGRGAEGKTKVEVVREEDESLFEEEREVRRGPTTGNAGRRSKY
ncbi:hypothetical protein LTR17_006678 [Elasticomyces elasticus]|nr:hypothetical protein LTR17_006678 [Elasticomyces elasticus]